jgi:hypothetical protein
MQVWAGDYEKFVFVKIGWTIRTIVRRRVEQLIKAMADNGAGGAEMPIDGRKTWTEDRQSEKGGR